MAAATGIERPNPTFITALRMRAFLLARVTADECWRVVSPTQALNCAARLNCLKSPTVATAAGAPTGPMPINVAAFFTPALSLACAAMRSSHQAMWASSARRCACACCTHSRARVFISLPASSSVSMSTASSAAGPCAKKCICGRLAASHTAAASLALFLPLAPSRRYGLTSWTAMTRASRPSTLSLRAQWCELELVYMATMQPAGNCVHQAINLFSARARMVSTYPAASTACTCSTRFAKSTPTRTAWP